MDLRKCHNFHDFRRLAKRRLPGPIFDYIEGGADDEATLRRNTKAFETCDLVPYVLRGVKNVDLSVTVMGQKLALPVYCSPTALQRLFHHQGERAVAAAAAKFGTMFGVSSLGTVSLEELRKAHDTPQVYQFYFLKDRGLNRAMLQRAKDARVEIMMLAVDYITGGNRERDLRTGFLIPDAPKILYRNVYGWFKRTARGVYALTEAGQAALQKWPQSDVEGSHAAICLNPHAPC